jgi:predicted PurR-regulated permease PerM
MSESGATPLPDRRRADRRADLRVADLTLPELRRMLVTTTLGVIVIALFLWMVRTVIISAIIGVVMAVFLRPVYLRLNERTGRPALSAVVTLMIIIVPVLAALAYSYLEISNVVDYLNRNQQTVVTRIDSSLAEFFPWMHTTEGSARIAEWVRRATDYGSDIPETVQEAVVTFAVATTIFLFTTFYVLTEREEIVAYIRRKIPSRYGQLVMSLENNVRGVLHGTVYSTLLTQTLKSVLILILNLAFGVPLAAVLALASFVIGFFPIVGSWSIYVPVAAWLLIFKGSPTAALLMIVIGFGVNTLFISMYLRPKIAADRSRVLNFYWMLVGLVTGVYTFGLSGILLGPILIGLLKAMIDTVTASGSWRFADPDPEADPESLTGVTG